jgi:serine/threonine protein kinase
LSASIDIGLALTGAAALQELLSQLHIDNRPGLSAFFDRGPRGRIPLKLSQPISAPDLKTKDIFELEGDCHYVDPSFVPDLCLSFSNYTFIRPLGRGAFADVYLYHENTANVDVAVRVPDRWDPLTRDFQDFIRQIEIMCLINHHCVRKIYGVFDSTPHRSSPALVVPFMVNGSVFEYQQLMKTAPSPNWTYTQKYIIIYGIALGMAVLHSSSVIHRNLSPSNVLLDENLDPKVAGFTLSKIIVDPALENSHHGGTLFYKAPEVLSGEPNYGQSVDVYSFAITVLAILTGLDPFPKASDYAHARRVCMEMKRPTIPAEIPRGIADLMKECWDNESQNRPTFDQITARMEEDRLLENVDREQFRAFRARVAAGSAAADTRT